MKGRPLLHRAVVGELEPCELSARGNPELHEDVAKVITLSQLTPQELQIAGFVAQGLANKEIAAQMFLSKRTID